MPKKSGSGLQVLMELPYKREAWKRGAATFFAGSNAVHPKGSIADMTALEVMEIANIRQAVEWSKTSRGGIQYDLLWSGKTSNWFTAHLIKAQARHRGANQCRHTFASQALSSYVPVEWVARQLGHSNTTMVKKHYGRWIPEDTKSVAAVVSEMMGFSAIQTGS